jgi:DNA (cytosine-5)-methyltransferase 1
MSALPKIEPLEPRRTPRKARPLLVADLFCGAGGSSTGAHRALEEMGLSMTLTCVNHWPVAIETHRRNHPTARHYCQDLNGAKPRELVPEGRLDLLMASPTCTYYSRARGGKPSTDQQRMDPEHILPWLTQLRVRVLLIENVPEFVEWGPLNAKGRPIKSRKGEYFLAWVNYIKALGFKVEWRFLCAADYGDATTRERFFLVARSDGRPIRWPEPTHAPRRSVDMFGSREQWRGAREIIDWSIRGASIFTRKAPLSVKTLTRIYAGAVKFAWPEPLIARLVRHIDATYPGTALPRVERGSGTPRAFTISSRQHTGGPAPRDVGEPVATITASDSRLGLVEPFVLSQHGGGIARPVSEPAPGITTDGAHALVAPYYGSGSGKTCKSVDDPLDAITTKDRFGLVVPITHANKGAETGGRVRGLEQPLPAITGANRGELAFITAAFGEREGQAPRVHDIAEPCPTICAGGRINLAEPDESAGDILYRMFKAHELAAAMGFNADETRYEFVGNETEVKRQIGNAVPVHTATALVAALMGTN